MVLAVDASRLAGRRTGVGRYLEWLLRAWSQQPVPFEEVRLYGPKPSRPGGFWWQATELRRRANEASVLFAPYALPPRLRVPAVVANLGLLEGRYADRSPVARARSWHAAASARAATAVVTHSAVTRDDLVEHFGVRREKVVVIPIGVDGLFRPPREADAAADREIVAEALGEDAPFVLCVGKLSPRRHVPELVEAFTDVARADGDLRLLLVGPSGDGAVPARDGVRHLDHLDQARLAALYRRASAFVLPTEKEGFSFTILEALASGCPVLTVEHAALGEGGVREAVATVPSPAPSRLAEGLTRLLHDDALRERLTGEGLAVARRFSWEETARRTMDVLAAVARPA